MKNGGQKGPQVDILRPGTYNIHTGMFKVEIREAVSVGDGQIGVVESLGGEPMTPARSSRIARRAPITSKMAKRS